MMRNDLLISAILWLFTFSISYFFSKISSNYLEKLISFIDSEGNKTRIFILIILGIAVTVVFYSVHTVSSDLEVEYLIAITSLLLTVLVLFMLAILYLFYVQLKQSLEIEYRKELLEELSVYTKSIENIHDEIRGYHHDILNITSALHIFLEKEDIDGLKNFFYNNIVPMDQKFTEYNIIATQLKNIHIPEFKGFLALKLISALGQGIKVGVEVCEPITELNIDIIDLIRITGILMDNAIV